jgi:methylglutaconyl-CoA hydratase
MMSFLKVEKDSRKVVTVTLNRPEIHNAFNDKLIHEITDTFDELSKSDARLIILTGEGKSFCAGADLNWMSSMINYSEEENHEDSLKLAQMFQVINECPMPILGRVNGHALGGGVGLLSVCDFVHTHDRAKFGFTEVKLGLIPAVISPFVIAKIGESHARAWFLSGELFKGKEAKHMGLVHKVSEFSDFEKDFEKTVESFLLAGPNAAQSAKELVKEVLSLSHEEVTEYTCSEIARIRNSDEGQDGMKALLNKTKASWVIGESNEN